MSHIKREALSRNFPEHEHRTDMDSTQISKYYARCFSSSNGCIVLEHLISQTLLRHHSANIEEKHLFYLEGQRALVNRIRSLVRQGRASSEI